MAFPAGIGAVQFSRFIISTATSGLATAENAAQWQTLFTTTPSRTVVPTAVDASTNELTIPTADYAAITEGDRATFTGVGSVTGIDAGTVYYIVKQGSDEISLATSRANAVADTPVVVTLGGTLGSGISFNTGAGTFVSAADARAGTDNVIGADTVNVVELPDIRDMPSFGTPANIVKVPSYGAAITQSIGAQPDAPDLEFTLNYDPQAWANTPISSWISDGVTRGMGVVLLQSQYNGDLDYGTVNSLAVASKPRQAIVFFRGRFESLLTNVMRDDAATNTITLSVRSDFYGPFTW